MKLSKREPKHMGEVMSDIAERYDKLTKTNKMSKEEIIIEHKIIDLLRKDNVNKNTFHFQEHGVIGKRFLDLYTYNPRTETLMFYHGVDGINKIDCLEKMLEYIKGNVKKMEYSWTVIWEGSSKEHHVSYFRGITESEVKLKCTSCDNNVKKIISITKMPIS
jgi:hypothetical protein